MVLIFRGVISRSPPQPLLLKGLGVMLGLTRAGEFGKSLLVLLRLLLACLLRQSPHCRGFYYLLYVDRAIFFIDLTCAV